MWGKSRTASPSPPTSRHSGMPPMSPLKDGSEKQGQKRKEDARVKGAIHKNRPSAWMARASLDRGHPQKQASSVDDSGSRRSMHTETGPQRHKCSDVRGWSIGPEGRQQSAGEEVPCPEPPAACRVVAAAHAAERRRCRNINFTE